MPALWHTDVKEKCVKRCVEREQGGETCQGRHIIKEDNYEYREVKKSKI